MFRRLLPVLPALALAACESAPVAYKIEPIDPAQAAAYLNAPPEGPVPAVRPRRSVSSTAFTGRVRTTTPPPRALPVAPRAEPVLAQENTQRVDVYRRQADIRGMHRVVGEVRLTTDGRQPPQAIRASFEREALSRNAQGVIIQDPADQPLGNGSGPSFENSREITATFIRYGERPSRGYGVGSVSPYAAANQYTNAY